MVNESIIWTVVFGLLGTNSSSKLNFFFSFFVHVNICLLFFFSVHWNSKNQESVVSYKVFENSPTHSLLRWVSHIALLLYASPHTLTIGTDFDKIQPGIPDKTYHAVTPCWYNEMLNIVKWSLLLRLIFQDD